MHLRLLTLFLLILFTSYSENNAQHFLRAQDKDIVNENGDPIILRGMGLGGWMLQEGYMLQTAGFANSQRKIRNKIEELIGEEDTEAFYDAWLANHVTKADIDSLKAWGFNSVRLPMHYNLYTLPIEEEPVQGQHTWFDRGFVMTDSLISWCKANEMYVILDLHAAPGGQGRDEAISDYDPAKPSLWESQLNRDKTVALWTKLAERYVDEQWVAGYDLLNETNWDMQGGQPLRSIYNALTTAIRAVDTKHIIFIEGNWFANDFTGLTPPWDDNLVYSPHKYWSLNDRATMQWVLTLREQHNVPLYLGESGENSNVWFRDAIKLLEDLNIGWAWWPMKKVEDIAGPLSIVKSQGYQNLLDYWNNGGPQPDAATAKATLMDFTERLKIANCRPQPDVIDAMFRQVHSDETIPYAEHHIPGVIHATDYDMGVLGQAYLDNQVANYQVSTGGFTAWNNGWTYRNDGVDIEKSVDSENGNGYQVGWTDTGEWMQYTVNVDSSAVYEVKVNVATESNDGQFSILVDGAKVTPITNVPATGGWQNFQTVSVPNVVIDKSDKAIRFFIDQASFNISSMEFIMVSKTTDIATQFASASLVDETMLRLNINKKLDESIALTPTNFDVKVGGTSVPVSAISFHPDNSRIVMITVDHTFKFSDAVTISHPGSQLNAIDGTMLDNFINRVVQNTLPTVHTIPGQIEAEDWIEQSGVQVESSADDGGGQNIGFLDPGDYLDYQVNVAQTNLYQVEIRTAAESEEGQIEFQIVDATGQGSTLLTVDFPATGGWQNWQTTTAELPLSAGLQTIRVLIKKPLFNMNWYRFSAPLGIDETTAIDQFLLYPNPANSQITISGKLKDRQKVDLSVRNLLGQPLMTKAMGRVQQLSEVINIDKLAPGSYLIQLSLESGESIVRTIVVQ